ncbi:acyl carrier protein [Luteimonas wenzhouensis]|jgi:acyl carrier protein|uniref:Acyl carrier protein n=1 Tax=Luteimonas wenzhouensis TaxID=2599615 RepID=A0A5C5U3T4_9GAMM|nr:acyl carrier protein [Luteimonas wenzhouensis]NLW96674.1 acyl carrier protein [Xanthomonadaceae bacterium]TWT20657.1 acyl carrier protein [Luteimonas wenzhouensis]
MTETAIRETIRGHILENLMFTDDPSRLPDDASLLEMGVIDSTGVLELVLLMEENFAMKVQDAAIIPENFDSVDRMVSFVLRSKSA